MPMLLADLPPAVTPPAMVEPAAQPAGQLRTQITPGAIWPDDRGKHIQAHGGGILKQGDTYYWFGEDRSRENEKDKCYVACYSSTDLMNWTFRNQVIADTTPLEPGYWWTLERPKVFYNAKNNQYVMWVHIEGGIKKGYGRGEVAIYTSDTVDGKYKFVRSFRPLSQESRDIGQFVDDDGSAYLISESRPTGGFFIYKLNEDFMDVEPKPTAFIHSRLEGGAVVKYDGLYYAIGSWMTGWDPNNNMYATSKSLSGPWSEFKDIAPKEKKTYGAQSTLMVKVVGSKTTTVIFMGDMWKPKTHWDGRYLWMPLKIGDGHLELPAPRPWSIDVKTGVVTFK